MGGKGLLSEADIPSKRCQPRCQDPVEEKYLSPTSNKAANQNLLLQGHSHL